MPLITLGPDIKVNPLHIVVVRQQAGYDPADITRTRTLVDMRGGYTYVSDEPYETICNKLDDFLLRLLGRA